VRKIELKNTRILNIDSSNRFLSTMPSKRTSNNIDLVEPTQYRVDPNRKAKEPPPGLCLLSTPFTFTIGHSDLFGLEAIWTGVDGAGLLTIIGKRYPYLGLDSWTVLELWSGFEIKSTPVQSKKITG